MEKTRKSTKRLNAAKVKVDHLQELLGQKLAYDAAKADFIKSQKAANSTKKQLDKANGLLDKAQVKLSSLQSGLAAANAAALAS